jgi:hypothetical protein
MTLVASGRTARCSARAAFPLIESFMRIQVSWYPWVFLLAAAAVPGCSNEPAKPSAPASNSAGATKKVVGEKFAELQAVIKNKNTRKLWSLLSSKSQDEAHARAKEIRSAHEKAGTEEKKKIEKEWGLSAADMAKLTGEGILQTSRFVRKADAIAESKITRVTSGANSGTVYFDESDSDHEKLDFVREDGQWKVWMGIPSFKKP